MGNIMLYDHTQITVHLIGFDCLCCIEYKISMQINLLIKRKSIR